MRSRLLVAALAAAGLWAGPAVAQVAPPANPGNTTPPTGTAPKTDPPAGTRPGTTPARPGPDNPTTPARPGTTTPPVVTPPATGVVPAGGTTGTGRSTTGTTGTAVVPPTPTTVPPELAKLEAQAAVEVPAPQAPGGRAPEARRVAEAAVKVRRATWVVEHLLPPPPEGVSTLSFAGLKVGARGWVDTTGDVLATHEGVMVVRPAGATAESASIGIVGDGTATTKTVTLRGEYLVDRALTVDGRDVLVLKEVAAAKALDPAQTRLISAARARLEEAKAEYSNAVGILAAAKKKAVDTVMERASAAAAKQVPVPDNATGEERIKAKADQDRLAQKLAKDELDKIAALYGDVPAVDPTRR